LAVEHYYAACGYQDHLADVNRVRDVDFPPGERLWGAVVTF
jgi:hypothetical protein